MNDLIIDKIEDILWKDARFHNEYGEDLRIDNMEELAKKIYDLFISEATHGFMCKTDYDWELGAAIDGNKVYPSEKALREHRSCVDECGIVKVAVTLVEVVQEEDWSKYLD